MMYRMEQVLLRDGERRGRVETGSRSDTYLDG